MKKTTKFFSFIFLAAMVCGCGGKAGDGTLTAWSQELVGIMNNYYGQVIPVAPFSEDFTFENDDVAKTIVITDLVPVKIADYGTTLINGGYTLSSPNGTVTGVEVFKEYRIYLKSLGASSSLSVSLAQLASDLLTITTAIVPKIGGGTSVGGTSIGGTSVGGTSIGGISQGGTSQGGTSVVTSVATSQSGSSTVLPLTADFTAATMPSGWTYYSGGFDPSYYASVPGLKLAHLGTEVTSPTFTAVSDVTVTLNIVALNANTKTAGSEPNIITVYGYNASGSIVDQSGFTAVSIGANTLYLDGYGIVRVEVEFTNYPVASGTAQNINLASIVLS